MQDWQAMVLGALQGVAELFPISSLAQTILIPALLGWKLNGEGSDFLAFVVALHLATAVALVLYFWRDWLRVARGLLGSVTRMRLVYDDASKFAWLLVAGTVIVGVVGLAAEKKIRTLFDRPQMAWIVGCVLVANGFVMLFGDLVKRRAARAHPGTQPEHQSDGPAAASDRAMHAAFTGGSIASPAVVHAKPAEALTFPQATAVGAAQVLALLPGISRSGVTIIGGLWAGLSYEQASRFAFMLATPVIAAAALKKIPDLIHQKDHHLLVMAAEGSAVAFVAAFLSIAFLMRYFHSNRLAPFGYFCILFGGAAAYWLKVHPAM